jgi:CPA1 family monovalent cation:H+ antiporter
MHETELLLLGLLVAVPTLSVLARALGVPYPIVLVLGGLPLGFIPGVPDVALDPDLVLVLFLPPLLYVTAFFANLRELRADARAISLSAFPLVLFTTGAVAVAAHTLIDGLPWAAAFALGAVVSPTDPIAATAIFHRLGAPRRLISLIEGEALINDSSGLIAYRLAVAAAVGGGFSLLGASARFLVSVAGGIAIGLAASWLIALIRRRLEDPPVELTISLFTGYAAYLPAEQLGVSGVLAAVTAGIYLGWRAPEISSATMRIQAYPVWEFALYLINAVLFLLIGLDLPRVLEGIRGLSAVTLIAYAAAICAIVVGARLAWMFTVPYIVRALDRRPSQVGRRVGARPRLVLAWAGLRGAVSLAAALSLPLETDAGAPFPQRELLIFLAYAVVLFTVVGQGLTLPTLIRRLGVRDDGAEQREEIAARIRTADAALERLEELAGEEWTREEKIEKLRAQYAYQRERFAAQTGEVEDDGYEDHSLAYQRLVRELIEAQRSAIVRLRNEGTISNEVMHRIERELDLEESRLENPS